MDADSTERPTVLIADDEEHLADLYADYLGDEYVVRTVYGGQEAIEALSPEVDVALIDRRMPVVTGNEVLAEIEERGLDCRVALVTAADPDFDIIDMGCDDYLVKPVTRDELREVVERLTRIAEYNERVQELSAKRLQRNVLQVEKRPAELESNEEFQSLQEDIEALEEDVEEIAEDLGIDT